MKLAEIFGKSKSVSIKTAPKGTVITVNRKSRFIMKDAKALLAKIDQAGINLNKEKLILKISGPICSKSTAFLTGQGIEIK